MMEIDKLCLHTVTTKPLGLERSLDAYARVGMRGVTLWRDAVLEYGIDATLRKIESTGLQVVSYCRGGFFPGLTSKHRQDAINDNIKMIYEAAQLEAPLIVLVPGADPGQSLEENRQQIQAGIEAILPYAADQGVRLGIEPLHPMYAGDRSAINSLTQANDLCEEIDSEWLGVVVDVYHLWWEPYLKVQIDRCGAHGNIFAFHVSDWKVPTLDLLNDRGLMGEGCIPIRQIRQWVENAGFDGMVEVEIFSDTYWRVDQEEYIRKIVDHFEKYV